MGLQLGFAYNKHHQPEGSIPIGWRTAKIIAENAKAVKLFSRPREYVADPE
jgi:hypothetical protein